MRNFKIDVIFVQFFFLNQTCILATFNNVLIISVKFIKSNRFCTLTSQSSGRRYLMQKSLTDNERLFSFGYPTAHVIIPLNILYMLPESHSSSILNFTM